MNYAHGTGGGRHSIGKLRRLPFFRLCTTTGLGYPLIKMVMETTETGRNLKKSPEKKTKDKKEKKKMNRLSFFPFTLLAAGETAKAKEQKQKKN